MARTAFSDAHPTIRLTQAEFEAIPPTKPTMVSETDIGTRWREMCWGGVRIRQLVGFGPDGCLVASYRPIVRVQAISRMVPRAQVAA